MMGPERWAPSRERTEKRVDINCITAAGGGVAWIDRCLVVLIPEWLAEGTLTLGSAATTDPARVLGPGGHSELRLASMTLLELRRLARQRRVYGYASENRDRLTARLLNRARRRNSL